MNASPRPVGAAVAAVALARLAAARPRAALAALALAVAMAVAAAATLLRVDPDSTRLLSPDLPFQQRAHALNAAFPALRASVLVVAEADTVEGAEAALAALAAELEGRPEIAALFAPALDPFFRAHGFLYAETAALERTLTRLSQAAPLLAGLRADPSAPGFLAAVDEAGALAARAEFDPAALDGLYAEAAAVWAALRAGDPRAFSWRAALDDGAAGPARLTMTVEPRPDPTRLSPARPALDALAAAIARIEPALGGARLSVTGEPALRAEEMRSVLSGLGLSFAVSLVSVAAILALAMRSAKRVAVSVTLLLSVIALSAGFAAVAIGALNLVSFAFVVLMTGMGEDFIVHFLFEADEQAAGRPPAEAAVAAAAALGGPMALAAAATAIAFFAFAFTDFIGMAQLGLIGGAGVILSLLVTLVGVPAAAALVPGLLAGRGAEAAAARPRRTRPGRIGAAAAAVALALLIPASAARFDADPVNLRDPASPAVQAFRRLAADPDLTPYRLSVLAPDDAAATALAEALRALPAVARATAPADLVPEDQDAKLDLIDLAWPSVDFALSGVATPLAAADGPEAARARLIERLSAPGAGAGAAAFARELALGDPGPAGALDAALFRFFPALLDRLAGLGEARPATFDDLPAPLRARLVAADGTRRVEATPAGEMDDPASMRAFVEAVTRVAPPAGGPDQIVGAAGAVGGALLTATGVAAAAIAALTLAATRRPLETAAVIAPLAAAAVATAAGGVLLGAPFNYANIIVAPLLIGLGVNAGVYVANAARRDPARVFETVTPSAVFFSTATTLAAFGSLALSSHRGVASMGLLLTVSLAATLAAALTLTPAILALGRRGGAP